MRWSLIRKRPRGDVPRQPPPVAEQPVEQEDQRPVEQQDQQPVEQEDQQPVEQEDQQPVEPRQGPRSLLRLSPPPPVRGLHPFRSGLGIFDSAIAAAYRVGQAPPPYVPRDVDSWLDEALATSLFVLVTGSSNAGKSRTAFAAATRMEPEPLLLVPASARALPDLLASDEVVGDGRPALLWLDDLARYLTVPGVRPALFESVKAKREANGQTVVVLATLNLTESGALLSATGEIGRSMREILGSAFEVTVPSEMSPAERERATRLYPGQQFSTGIGQHFTSTFDLINRLKDCLR